ncbi:MAG TPA: LysR family transcriptional regulator [Bellilinea sp.]|jgi:DNA-binding transcriptional LysR family regulator|nr:LysR family transcriptional regulator [Bellilinea sp.]
MDIRQLRIFVTVCETSSMTKAAQRLFMAQPSISQAIGELEQEYNVRLFERLNHRLYITAAGERLLTYAYHILNLTAQAQQELEQSAQAGKIRLAASLTIGGYVLPELIRRFKEHIPEAEIFTQVDNTAVIERLLLEDRLDLGLVEGPVYSAHITEKYLWTDELIIIASPQNVFCRRKGIKVGDLAGQAFIMREQGSGTRDVFEQAMRAAEIEINISGIYNNIEAIKRAVANDLGLAVIPRIAVSTELAEGSLAEVPINGLTLQRKFNLVYHKQKYFTPLMQQFVDICKAQQAAVFAGGNEKGRLAGGLEIEQDPV